MLAVATFAGREGSFVCSPLSSFGFAKWDLLLEGVMCLSCPRAVAALWPNARRPDRRVTDFRTEKSGQHGRACYGLGKSVQKSVAGKVIDQYCEDLTTRQFLAGALSQHAYPRYRAIKSKRDIQPRRPRYGL